MSKPKKQVEYTYQCLTLFQETPFENKKKEDVIAKMLLNYYKEDWELIEKITMTHRLFLIFKKKK